MAADAGIKIKSFFGRLSLILGLVIIFYLIALPLYPLVRYNFFPPNFSDVIDSENQTASSTAATSTAVSATTTTGSLTDNNRETEKQNANRIIIKKIGVNAPIIESANEQYGLNHGAWHYPSSGTPGKSGNMVITGHRFKYLPPNNLTFYLLDKLETGDAIAIVWNGKPFKYRVSGTKIVSANETSILAPTDDQTLTVFTCDPIYSTENRLVIIAKPE